MKRRLTLLLYALLLALVLQQIGMGLVLALNTWSTAQPQTCVLPGAPVSVETSCRLGVAMSEWGTR